MVGTMTAPTFATAATYRRISLSFVDASNDVWTGAFRAAIAATPVQIDALVADIVARSNGSLFYTEDVMVREGAKTTTNATILARSQDVHDAMLMTFKNVATGASQHIYIPAPLEAVFEATTGDVPDITDLSAVGLDALPVLGAGYVFRSARYTKHKDQNQAVAP